MTLMNGTRVRSHFNYLENTMLHSTQTQAVHGLDNLSFIRTSVMNALRTDCIETEVDSLVEESRNNIGLFEATDSWLADNIATLPEIVGGEVLIQFDDSRGYKQQKYQSLSDSLWVITMKQVQYHSSVNYDLLSAAYANWICDNVYTKHESLGRDLLERVKVTAEQMVDVAKSALTLMQEQNIITTNLVREVVRLQGGNNITARVYKLTPEFTVILNEYINTMRVAASMKCRPLQHMPKDWVSMNEGVADNANLKLVARAKVKTNIIAPKVLEAVNKLQRVRFVVAPCILEAAKDMVMNRSLYTSAHKDYFSDKELNSEAFDLYSEIANYANKEFYFPVTMDSRGRMYYRGGLVSPQGVDFCKAACQFAEFKKLGTTGFRAIALHTANVCGMDKVSINKRVAWVRDNWDTIMNIETHRCIRKQFKGADVFQALVACKELQRLAQLEGEWSEKTSNLVCHQDGTCNGLQHMAAITGDRKTAIAVNCVASGYDEEPKDVYGIVAKEALKYAAGIPLDMIGKYGRDMSKNPVMVTSYGASESTIVSNTASFLKRKSEDATSAQEVGEAYLEAISNVAGAVTQLTDALVTRVSYAVEAGKKKFTWLTADGFLASTVYHDDEQLAVRVGLFHVRKRNVGKAPLDARKTAQAMAPNFVHSIDSTHLRMTVNACDHELVTVHDSIGSHPCDYFETARMVREKFALVHNCYDALGDLCEGMDQPKPEFPREGDYNAREALESVYIFS